MFIGPFRFIDKYMFIVCVNLDTLWVHKENMKHVYVHLRPFAIAVKYVLILCVNLDTLKPEQKTYLCLCIDDNINI